jgi:protein O-mannosyl-transferase
VQLAEHACSLAGSKMPVLLGTLAAAYAEAGRFTEAVTTAANASALAAQIGDSATASKNQELMGLYRANRAYRETQ